MQDLRQAERVYEEISDVPYMFQGTGVQRRDPRRSQGKLVII